MTNAEKIQEQQEIAAQALAAGDQVAYYQARRELASLAEHREHYNRRFREMLDGAPPVR